MNVVGIGNALVDALVRINDDRILKEFNLPKGSMTLIDIEKYKKIRSLLWKENVSYVAAGSAANTIVGLASLGVKSGFLGNVGSDSYASIFENSLKAHGVKPYLEYTAGNTGIASTFILPDGERTFATYLGVASDFKDVIISDEELKKYGILYIEGYLIYDQDLIRQMIAKAKKNGLLIALDMASYTVIEQNRDFFLEIINQSIDILFANKEEVMALVGKLPEEAMPQLSQWVDVAVINMGSDGSLIQQKKNIIKISAVPDVSVVDTTGAGDLFAAGFLYGYSLKLPLEVCGKIGTLLASEVIKLIGAKISDDIWILLRREVGKIIES